MPTPRRLLVSWDLGGGLGHITALAGVLERLPEHIAIHALVRNVEAAREWFPERCTLVKAPGIKPHGPRGKQLTYADLLGTLGWHDPKKLKALIGEWSTAIEDAQADAILFDTSPATLLATWGSGVPKLGFCNPWGCVGDRVPLPGMRPWAPIDDALFMKHERRLLGAIRQATGVKLRGLAQLYDVPHMIYGIRETDPWWKYRGPKRTYVGPVVHTGKGREERFPEGHGARVFAYIRGGYAHRALVLDAVARLGRPALAYVPNHREVRRGLLRITGEPIRIDRVVEDADLVVTHSVLGTGFSFLRSGVPVLLLPMQGEQMAMSWRCSGLPGIESLPQGHVERRFEEVLHRLIDPVQRRRTAATRQALNAPEDPFGRVADRLLEMLA